MSSLESFNPAERSFQKVAGVGIAVLAIVTGAIALDCHRVDEEIGCSKVGFPHLILKGSQLLLESNVAPSNLPEGLICLDTPTPSVSKSLTSSDNR